MAKLELNNDFKDLLKLLISNEAEFLLVGGYAVSYHGYPRGTGDMDLWIPLEESNNEKVIQALIEFGMPSDSIPREVFTQEGKNIRMGVPPVRIELLTGISGVEFHACYARRMEVDQDGMIIPLISLEDLKMNKKASGRHRDLDDLDHLP
jgi:predicted nucleotidyltransferase